jgi:hypothetical protein
MVIIHPHVLVVGGAFCQAYSLLFLSCNEEVLTVPFNVTAAVLQQLKPLNPRRLCGPHLRWWLGCYRLSELVKPPYRLHQSLHLDTTCATQRASLTPTIILWGVQFNTMLVAWLQKHLK